MGSAPQVAPEQEPGDHEHDAEPRDIEDEGVARDRDVKRRRPQEIPDLFH